MSTRINLTESDGPEVEGSLCLHYYIVTPRKAEAILNHEIEAGESLLLYGVDDFGEILSWINLADVALEFVPSCRASFYACMDWFGTNRERVEVTLTVLRDARVKVHKPSYFSRYAPSAEYWALMEIVYGPSPLSRRRNRGNDSDCVERPTSPDEEGSDRSRIDTIGPSRDSGTQPN